MSIIRKETIDTILDIGPFDRETVEGWPTGLRDDYFELMAIDLANLGAEEFFHQARLLGETYLLSFGEPIADNRTLLNAWRALTGGETPPPPVRFVFRETCVH